MHRRPSRFAFALRPLAFGSLALVALAAVAPAHAAGGGTTSAFADTSKPATFLREIVVTGARYPRAYYQSPQALSFLNRVQLREQSPVVTGDALQALPGVDNSKDSPWEQRPVLRGLSGQRVVVLMDGIPMNSARGNGPHPSLVDPSQIERVEVVRGPSSVSYGSDALGGAINIITREALAGTGRSLTGAATLSGGTAEQQYGGSFELAPRIGKLGAFVSAGFRHADDFKAPANTTVPNSSFKDYDALVNARYDASEHTTVKAGWQIYRASDIGIPGLSAPTANYGPGNNTVFDFRYYDRDLAHLTLEHQYPHAWITSSKVRFYWQNERRNFWSNEKLDASVYPFYGVPNNGSKLRNTDQDRFFDLDTWGMQVQMASVRTARYFFTGGLDLARDVTGGNNNRHRNYVFATSAGDSAGRITNVTSQSVPSGRFDSYAAFWQNEMYLTRKWTLSSGLRWTQYRYRTDYGPSTAPPLVTYFPALKVDNGAAGGSLGMVYELVPDLHVSFNVANGYRQPNAQDLFFHGPASVGFVVGNADLKPEKSISYDTGLRWERGMLALSGNAFYSTYTDFIDALSVTPVPEAFGQPTYQYKNVSKARIWGGEAEGEWLVTPQWRVRATASGQVGDITSREALANIYQVNMDKAPLPNVPPFRGTFALRWTEPGSRGWLEPSFRYSWRTNRLPLPVPGVSQIGAFKKEWFVVDLNAAWKFPTGQRLALGVRNLGDTHVRQALGSLDEPGRSFVGSVTTTF